MTVKRVGFNTAVRRIYISSTAGEPADGTPRKPFGSLDDALGQMRASRASVTDGDGRPHVNAAWEISYIRQSGASPRGVGQKTYEYYVDAMPTGRNGDGTLQDPWPDWETALARIGKLHSTGGQPMEAGEQIRLVPRDVFAPTPLELRRGRIESIVKHVFMFMSLALVVPVLLILTYLVVRAWPVLSPDFLLTNPQGRMTAGGVWAPLVGTFCLVVVSLLVAAPIGILAGVYLNEYAQENWFTRVVNLAVVNLAGVPSIVHALFGVGAFVLFAKMGRSVLAASCTLAVMTLPVIITSTREALASVPMSFREACWNMGASRWQTIRTIVLPNSMSGILTGVILQVARAAGETAPILFTGAVFFMPVANTGWDSFFPYRLGDTCMALSMHLFTLSTQVAGVPDSIIYGTAVVLIGLVLAVNSLAIVFRVYLRSHKKW